MDAACVPEPLSPSARGKRRSDSKNRWGVAAAAARAAPPAAAEIHAQARPLRHQVSIKWPRWRRSRRKYGLRIRYNSELRGRLPALVVREERAKEVPNLPKYRRI
jgi:hypothetical protein